MRYKIFACILVILSVFSFVLAAPVPVREIREACADAVEGGENVIIVSGKRAPRGYGLDSDSDTEWWKPSPQSSSAPDHAGGSHSGVDMPGPSSPSSGSESPPWSKVLSTPGGTDVPLDPNGAITPGTTTENQPASSSKTKSVSWEPVTKVHSYDEELEPLPSRFPPKNNFVSNFKNFFGKLGKLKFRPRFQRTVDT
jgi:hypothetical protein